jgi:hypothetical protein
MKKPPFRYIVIGSFLVFLYLVFYTVATPYIKGVVVDATTKKPVENAWVIVAAGTIYSNIAGGMEDTREISSPHTRTDKNGVFTVRPKIFFSIPFPPPLGFGMYAGHITAMVRAADGRRAEIKMNRYWWIHPLPSRYR